MENRATIDRTVPADGFEWLGTVDIALQRMLEAINAARDSIRFEVYIFRSSSIGEAFREALLLAAKRGVKVQILIDAMGSISLPERFWGPVVQAGGLFRWFNPLKFRRISFRNHRKLLVCDETTAFIGGFNVAPEYQGDGVTKGWQDVGMMVSPELACELAHSFDAMFALADYQHLRFTRLRKSQVQRIVSTSQGQVVLTGPSRGPYLMKGALLDDSRNAHTVNVISAYFLPPREFRRAFTKVARTGGTVRLVTAGKSDVLLAQLAARRLYQHLLSAGVEIYEYQPQVLHTKLFIFDEVVYVGSANLDKRSLYINYELLVRMRRPEITKWANNFFENTLSHCKRIDLETWRKSRTVWAKLREQWAFFLLSRIDPYLSQLQMRSRRVDLDVESSPADF